MTEDKTDPPEVTRAIEAVAKALASYKYGCAEDRVYPHWIRAAMLDARQILSLPMVRVVADDQASPNLYGENENLDSMWVCEATQEDMKRAGFQRVFEVKGE